ncbi:MAG TPA: murein biosynthesis integral membrane protein MurJ, partial [Propionibacteriaceae bacterium]|nr:murein biosynthesis integral membrane protein MurJ [Propionibacteriaceae bacterium]
VIWLAMGTIPFMVTYVLYRGFYALEDNKTPFFIQLVISAVNAGAALVLVLSENEPATVAQRLGLAYSLAYLVGAVVCFVLLKRRLPGLSPSELLQQFARLSLASLPAA